VDCALHPFPTRRSSDLTDPEKHRAAERLGALALQVLDQDLRPSRILTRPAFDNAIAAVAASGGSTNAVLHLLALAREVGVDLAIDRKSTRLNSSHVKIS